MPLEYVEDGDEEILNAEDEVYIDVAADTGSVAHVAAPKDLPGSIPVVKPPSGRLRNFVAANKTPIANHGTAEVLLEMEDGCQVVNSFNVADVSRPLHSISVICDAEHEVLFTKGCGTVVPAGSLSRYLAYVRNVARYPRRGGLYVARMKARDPKRGKRPGFTRPGVAR